MAALNGKKTNQNLLRKGFVKSENDHHFFEFWHNGILVTKTKTSHNNQDIGDTLISLMSKQCKVDKHFFMLYAKCARSKDDYIAELRSSGVIK